MRDLERAAMAGDEGALLAERVFVEVGSIQIGVAPFKQAWLHSSRRGTIQVGWAVILFFFNNVARFQRA